MSKLKDTDFLYISTRLRSMENRMLSRERMERMLEARTDEDAAKVLSECGYTGLEKADLDSLSQALSAARAETFSELASMSPNSDIVDVFRMKYDYHNLKALMKCAHSGKDAGGMLIDAGRYPLDTVKRAVEALGNVSPVRCLPPRSGCRRRNSGRHRRSPEKRFLSGSCLLYRDAGTPQRIPAVTSFWAMYSFRSTPPTLSLRFARCA